VPDGEIPSSEIIKVHTSRRGAKTCLINKAVALAYSRQQRRRGVADLNATKRPSALIAGKAVLCKNSRRKPIQPVLVMQTRKN
jgi:hypothetical protein